MDDALKRSGIDHIDFLSLDVEGAELATLDTMNFRRTPTFVILVEMRKVDEGTNPKIRRYLHHHGFCRFADSVGHSNEVWINPKYDQRAYIRMQDYSFDRCIDREKARLVSQMKKNPPHQIDESDLSALS